MKSFYTRTALLLLLFSFLFVAALQAQNLVTYNFAGGSLAPSSTNSNVTATNLNFTGSTASQYPSPGFPYLFLTVPAGATNATTAVSSNSYFQFTLTPNSAINLTNLTFGVGGNNPPSGGVQKEGYAVRSSADGYASNLASGVAPVQFSALNTITVSLSAAGFQNLSTAVTFRIYGFINTSISFEREPAIVFNNVTVNGTIPAPEINLKGNGNPIANSSFNPSTSNDTDFGSSVFGSGAVEKTFTIENLGGSALNLTGPQQNPVEPLVKLGGLEAAAFSVTALPSTPIAGGSSTTFKIAFNPSTIGTKNANVTIINDDANEGFYFFSIRAAACVNNPVVTTTANDGAGSLRQAIIDACAGSTITFDPSVFGSAQTITLNPIALDIKKNLTITGPGVDKLTINQTGFGEVLSIQSGNTVNISGLKMTGGGNGGIFNYGGTVTVTNCEVSGIANNAPVTNASSGIMTLIGCVIKNNTNGGVNSYGTSITLTNCEISDNDGLYAAMSNTSGTLTLSGTTIKNNAGGGIVHFGTTANITNCEVSSNDGPYAGVYNTGNMTLTDCNVHDNPKGGVFSLGSRLTITNCQIVNNTSTNYGGGILNGSGILTISGSTISGNTGVGGGGIASSGTSASITNTKIFNNTSNNDNGGGILAFTTTTITDCTITGNTTTVSGGGICATSTANVIRSTIANNTAQGGAGGGGIFSSSGTLTLTNSTISGNHATSTSSGLRGGGLRLSGAANITSCTITDNDADGTGASNSAGGIIITASGVTIKNTIIAGNTGTNGANMDVKEDGMSNTVTSGGYNLVGDGTGATGFTGTADQVGTSGSPINALLGPLADNGGPTLTHKLEGGSPAVDKGNAFGLTTDQRGLARTEDNPVQTNAADGTDIGATERTCVSNPVVTTTANSGAGSLRDAIENACAGSIITFDPTVFGSAQTITLTSGVLTIDKNLTITGPGAKLLTISGNNADRVFLINPTGNATITGVTITDGFSTPVPTAFSTKNGGGIFILQSGQLTLNNCTISNNETGTGGNGGGICNNGTLTVTNCTISGNTTDGDGGGIFNNATSMLTLTNSTISGNTCTFFNGGGINNTGTMSVSNSTITNNSAKAGGGIINFNSMSLKSSIVAGNTAENRPDLFAGSGTSQGYNLFGSETISPTFTTVATDVLTSSPGLGILADNGGPTQTHKLLGGSPAIDKGNAFSLTTDQRGLARTLDIASQTNAADGTDIGAIEMACTTPTFTACPTNKTAFTSTNACTAVVDYEATADGIPASVITYAFTGLTTGTGDGTGSGTAFNNGVTTVTLTATNDCGALTCQFTVTVTDNVKPIITCPSNRVLRAEEGLCSIVPFYEVITTDNCSASTTQTLGISSGTAFPVGGHLNIFRATDAAGNTATCSFTFWVLDGQSPVVTCPDNRTVNADQGLCSSVQTYTVATTDNCSVSSTIQTSGQISGAAFPLGTTTNGFTATDDAGNTSTCAFTVAVVDNQKPVITCPDNRTVNADQGLCSSVQTYSVTTTDNCSATTQPTAGLSNGAAFPVGITINAFLATDAAGNTATCSFSIQVKDTQVPVVTCPANTTLGVGDNCSTPLASYGLATKSDNCSTAIFEAQSPVAGTIVTGHNTAQTVTLTATDGGGNTASCSFVVTLKDVLAPSITCPANVIRPTDQDLCSAAVPYAAPIYSDNCSGGGAVHINGGTSGATFPKGTTIVNWQATDGVGLTKTCSFTVTVNDAHAPTITCPASIVRSNDAGQCSASVTYPTPKASDNCGLPAGQPQWVSGGTTPTASGANSVSTFQKGLNTVTWRATDGTGLTKTCTFRVTVNDTQAPTMTCPAAMSLTTAPNTCSSVATTYTNPTFTDNCAPLSGIATRVSGLGSGSSFPLGNSNVVFQATDAAGNTRRCTMVITVTDNQAPVITCPLPIVVTGTGTPCKATVFYGSTTASDNCAGPLTPFLVTGLASGSPYPAGVTTNTFRAVAPNGQSSECSFSVTVDCGSGMGNNGVEVRNADLNMQHGDKLELKLAPNPALSTVTVSIEGVGANGGTLLVFDAVGRLVLRQVIAENQQTAVFQVEGSEFAPGMYRVNLRTETGMVTKTLVVVK